MSRNMWWVIALSLLVIGSFFGYSIYQQIQIEKKLKKKKFIVRLPQSPEVQSNTFLAAQTLLEKRGIVAENVLGIPLELSPDDTLFLDNDRSTIGAESARRLLDWVTKGGHLVLTPPHDYEFEDHVFSQLKIYEDDTLENASEVTLDLPGVSRKLRIDMHYLERKGAILAYPEDEGDPNWRRLKYYPLYCDDDEDVIEQAPNDKTFYLRLSYGKGEISVLADGRFMHNDQIDKADHALIFWYLATSHYKEGQSKIWLINRSEWPALYVWLWKKAPYLVVTSMLAILVWMWACSRRCGPILSSFQEERRQLLEHVSASAIFLWNLKCGSVLVKAVRSALLRKISLRKPQWLHLEKSQMHKEMAELSGLSSLEVRACLEETIQKDINHFKKTIVHLEKIRRKL